MHFTPGLPAEGPYSSPPRADDDGIVAAVKSGRPEDIFGLAWSKPDFSASGHKIVRTFSIDGKMRPDREFIRCAICSSDHPKFLEGAVLWSPDRWLRLIGHVCAAKPEHFGEAGYRTLRLVRDQEERDEAAFTWLHANIALLPSLAGTLAQLRAWALSLEERQRLFFGKVKDLAERLETSVRQHAGVLSVDQELTGASLVAAETERTAGSARNRFQSIALGTLAGQSFLRRPNRKRSQQLDGYLEALARVPAGEGDTPILSLIDRGGEHEITITAIAVLRALQNAAKLGTDMVDARHFFDDENLSLVEAWGQDARNPMRFSLRRSGPTVNFKLADLSQITLSVAWPAIPDLSGLQRIVDAGVTLDGLLKRHDQREAE